MAVKMARRHLRMASVRCIVLAGTCLLMFQGVQGFSPIRQSTRAPLRLRRVSAVDHHPSPARHHVALKYANTEQENDTPAKSSQPIRPRPLTRRTEPVIAIVGRPNVGKSALVNRFCAKRTAIVADEPGITRDRTYQRAEFCGEYVTLVDTGGLVFEDDSLFLKEIRQQAMIAIDQAAAIIMVVDGQQGMTAMDADIAEFLRKQVLANKSNKHLTVHVAVNKCESEKTGAVSAADFWNLGLGEPQPVSALHGVGTAELMEGIYESIASTAAENGGPFDGFGRKAQQLQQAKANLKHKGPLPGEDETEYKMRKYGLGEPYQRVLDQYDAAKAAFQQGDEEEEINIAIIGRPNVGKSSLLNAIFGEDRAIVSDVAGTTRDSIDAVMERPSAPEDEGTPKATLYRFVDTAGIRRKNKVEYGKPEFFMVNRALRAIRRSDVVLLILDATAGVTEQDRILAQKISDDGRACVVVCNKWDAVVDKDSSTYDKSVKYIREELPQVRWAPILFISAETGQRVGKLYGLIDEAVQAHRKRISTSILNEILRDAILWQPPPARRNGAQAKIYYCNQVSTRPPTMVVFCNDPKLVNDNYRRYLDRKFRENLEGFEATPIRWIFRGRRQRDLLRSSRGGTMNGEPGDGGAGTSFPFPHAD